MIAERHAPFFGFAMRLIEQIRNILGDVLSLGDRRKLLEADTALIGNIPEFDSFAVISVITAIEEHFGFAFDDDEITGELFRTVGTLADFVETKLANG